jgi:CubicO group peptidase (beta-lactamase class C family)
MLPIHPVSNWDLDALAGAGGLRSSAADMLKFLAAQMGRLPDAGAVRLGAAMEMTQAPRLPTLRPRMEVGLGWNITSRAENKMTWHGGATGGYRAFAGFDRKQGMAIVVLSNTSNDIDDIGMHLLDEAYPLHKITAPQPRHAIAMSTAQFAPLIGRYRLAPDFVVDLTSERGKFYAQATGQPKFEILAEAPDRFFAAVADVQATVLRGSKGEVTGLRIRNGGSEQDAPKIKN